MSGYRQALPQLEGPLFLADGGLETWLVHDAGLELAHFAAFPLLRDDVGRAALRRYFDSYLQIAQTDDRGVVLDTPTWRANPVWGERLGYSADELSAADRDAVDLLVSLRTDIDYPRSPVVISGCVGPRDDAYIPKGMSAEDARKYHSPQVETFADTAADLVTAMTLGTVAEAIGIALAARDIAMPVAISFTTETDGRLPDGTALSAAIAAVDDDTDGWPAYYLVNCAHPRHFAAALDDPTCRERIRGVRANASALSHAELDEREELDRGDPDELANAYGALRAALPNLSVVGGCCGTDARHVRAISAALS